jgi:outer membrane protein OmpA-like peptidoglycan-associated protein
MNLLKPFIATAGFLLAMHTTTAPAEQVKIYDQPPSAEEMGRVLFDQSPESSEPSSDVKMRSISFGTKTPPVPKNKVEAKPRHSISKHKAIAKSAGHKNPVGPKNKARPSQAPALVSIGLPIKFTYNSDEILATSLPFLEEVGKMLTLPKYVAKRLVIEGHTDAIGSDSYNKTLSQQRANAVKHYLNQHFGIAEARLRAYGLGESRPLPDYSPDDEANRRVQFYSATQN